MQHIKSERAATKAEMAKSVKAEKVWADFVGTTNGVTKQQFALKLRAAKAQESEAAQAVSSYDKHLKQAKYQLSEDAHTMQHDAQAYHNQK